MDHIVARESCMWAIVALVVLYVAVTTAILAFPGRYDAMKEAMAHGLGESDVRYFKVPSCTFIILVVSTTFQQD